MSVGKLTDQLNRLVPSRDVQYFQINLGSRHRAVLAPLRRLLIGSCLLLTVSILWSLGQTMLAYQNAWTVETELERTRQQDAQVVAEARQEGIDLSDGALRRLPAEIELANQLLEKRIFSWTTFLTGLEEALPPRLALSSVRLDQSGTTVHLTGTAMSLEDITAFTVGLRDHQHFKDPVLAQHRVGANGLVEFDVMLKYRLKGA